jgi:glutamate-1-semialdehyde aminotransferase
MKNRIINKIMDVISLIRVVSDREQYVKSFRRVAKDPDTLLITDEGMEEYRNQLED